ncbi:MAG: BamA/TamA family outer membrane protein [Vicinamibacterales bacterium]
MTPHPLGRVCVVAMAFLAWCAPAASGQVPDRFVGRVVEQAQLRLDGRPVRDAQLEGLVEVRPGEPLDMRAVRETIVHLMGMGRFLDVQVSAFEDTGGVRVEIDLVPLGDVRRLVFTGETGLPESALREAVTDRFGASPAYSRAADIARALEELLSSRGYLRARVEHRAPAAGAAGGEFVFHVASGRRAVVRSVSYRSDNPADARDIQERVPLTRGAFFDRAELRRRLDEAVERWRARRYYEAAAETAIDESEQGDAVDVTITFVRGPLVTVSVRDNALTPKQLAELVPVEREGSVDEDLLEDSEARIEETLRARGYRDADASYIRTADGEELRIEYTVRYGPLYRVAGMRFEGAQAVGAGDLAPLMGLVEGQPFVQARLDADVRALVAAYRRRGFGSASVAPAIEPVPGARTSREAPVVVVLRIAEGPRTIVTAVEIAGTSVVPPAELEAGLATRVGGALVDPDVEADRDRLLLGYLNLGHRLARVESSVTVSPDRTAAQVRFEIEEGPRVYVDHILVAGNVRVGEATIRRELLLRPGEPLGLQAIEESQRRLAALGVFRRVTISELQHEADDRRDVLVTVEESPATTLGYGGGVEFQDVETVEFAPRGFFEIGRRNLWGKNRSVNLFSRLSLRRRSYTEVEPTGEETESSSTTVEYRVVGAYREPRFAGTSSDLQVTVGFEQGSRTSFSFRSDTARVNLSHRYGDTWSLQGEYAIQRNDIFEDRINPVDQPLIDRLYPRVRIGSASMSAVRSTRDDPFNPKRGTLVGLNGELALPVLGSEVGFFKTFLQGFVYRQLPSTPRVVVAAGARLGVGLAEQLGGDARDLPASERYFAGGDTTVRGFQLDRLGEPDTFDRDGTPIGGRSEIVLNGEVRLALWKDVGVVGFIDAGNVFSTVENLSLGSLRAGTGFGLRYNSPVGPFRVDFGFKLGTLRSYGPEREDRFALHISIGQAF